MPSLHPPRGIWSNIKSKQYGVRSDTVRKIGWSTDWTSFLACIPFFARLDHGEFARDLVAGLTLAAIAIPEQMATARLGAFAPQIGLFAFIAGSLTFAAFGASRYLSAGAELHDYANLCRRHGPARCVEFPGIRKPRLHPLTPGRHNLDRSWFPSSRLGRRPALYTGHHRFSRRHRRPHRVVTGTGYARYR